MFHPRRLRFKTEKVLCFGFYTEKGNPDFDPLRIVFTATVYTVDQDVLDKSNITLFNYNELTFARYWRVY
jgi:hypothetical protein